MESWAGPGNEASCIWYGQECLMHVFGVVMCSCMAFQQNELAIITNFRCMQVIVLDLLKQSILETDCICLFDLEHKVWFWW